MPYAPKIASVVRNGLFLAAALLLTLPLAANNLPDPNFWFDESGQFWMAKGLNHFSPPLSEDGSLYQVMLSNRQYNLDPGGFTLLLHFWLQCGSDPVWLRMLPYLFLVLALFSLMLSVFEVSGSALLAAAAAGVLLLPFPMILSYGFELRPYGMEVAGIIAVFYCLLRSVRAPSSGNLLLLGVVSSFFLTSRYSFIIPAASAGIVLFLCVYRGSLRRFALGASGFYLPLVCIGALIWLISFSHQNPGGSTPFYVKGFVLQGKDWPQVLQLIQTNFWSARDFCYVIFIALVPLFGSRLERRCGCRREILRAAWLFLFSFQILLVGLSLAGKYPWHINTRWDLNMQALVILADALLLVLAAGWLRRQFFSSAGRRGKLAAALCLLLMLALPLTTNKKMHYSNDALYPYLVSLGEAKLAGSGFFVGYYAAPSIRYTFEYGPLRDRRDIYPQNFYFESREEFGRQGRLATSRFDVALIALVDEEGLKKYRQRLGEQFRLDKSQPLSYLLLKAD